MPAMSPFDHLLVPLLVLAAPLVDALWLYPRLRRETEAGVLGARVRFYRLGLLVEWGFTAAVLALWVVHGRPLAALLLGASRPVPLAAGFALAALYAAVAVSTRRALLANPPRLARLRGQFESGAALLPTTPIERRWFAALSGTAGICEELLFRGYLPWYFGTWLGPLAAIAASCVLFGLAHAYLGGVHVLRTALVGAGLALVVLVSGSLLPAMVIHAAMDLLAGDIGPRALASGSEPEPDPEAERGAA
jgi:membrane protease YdiL (CAAX protease family)